MALFERTNSPRGGGTTEQEKSFSAARVVDEHFVPNAGVDVEKYIASGDLTAVHHLTRYLWARQVLPTLPRPARVLDLGCGNGYGSFLLAQANPESLFLGIDYDPKAIAEARTTYAAPNLEFRVGEPASWDASIGALLFGVVTCFDVLEHVTHRDLLLEGLVRHLEPGGALLFSTPSGSAENVLQPAWEHHRIEFCAASLYDLLRRYFGEIERSDDAGFPGREVFERLHERGIEYLLRMNPVVCRKPIVLPNPYRA